MVDTIETWNRSLIQHGPYNRRVYLMKLYEGDLPDILPHLDGLAREKNYEKILAKVPEKAVPLFEEAGYEPEAFIPAYFSDREGASFVTKYFSPHRSVIAEHGRIERILAMVQSRRDSVLEVREAAPCQVRRCTPADAEEMSLLYREIFKTYPFPIFDPHYLIRCMKGPVRYFCVREEKRIVALGASEMDLDYGGVEMTDFATRPGRRGRGLAFHLLKKMEGEMAGMGMRTAYTIARALSPGMNMTFVKGLYHYGGLLINNTNISGRIESMHVWYKPLSETTLL